MVKKVINNGSFSTRFKIIASGKLKPITAIINANAVPIAAPFSISELIIGMMPAAFEYSGIPMITAIGTDHQVFAPKIVVSESLGI